MKTTFEVPIYGGDLVICTTQEDYTATLKELEDEPGEDLDDVRGVSSRHSNAKNQSVYLIGVFDGDEATFVHELIHTCFELLTYCGIPINKRNDEVFAYLMDALYRGSIQAMRANANPAA